jgi:hypothetical protein
MTNSFSNILFFLQRVRSVKIIVVISIIITLYACSIEKRLHNPGWHINSKKTYLKANENNLPAAEKKIDEPANSSIEDLIPVTKPSELIEPEKSDATQSSADEQYTALIADSKLKKILFSNPISTIDKVYSAPVLSSKNFIKNHKLAQHKERRFNWGKLVFWLVIILLIGLAVLAVGFTGPGPNYAALILIFILVGFIIMLIVALIMLIDALLFDWWV